ncbi:MAG: hypothetical protein WEB78_00385 [Ilumatobacteraceae bacterium]
MTYKHAVVWMDHQHATVIDFTIDDQHVVKVESGEPHKLHRKSGPMGSGKMPEDLEFLERVVMALNDSAEIVLAGPGNAKTSFLRHLEKKHAALRKRVVGVETLDHPSDRELVAFARKYFRRVDSLLGPP